MQITSDNRHTRLLSRQSLVKDKSKFTGSKEPTPLWNHKTEGPRYSLATSALDGWFPTFYISRPFTIQKATLSARALMVKEGFTETADGISEPSATSRFG
jgi:hypothetical protein